MNRRDIKQTIKYQVEVSPVREMTLLASADLAFWQERITDEDLRVTNVDGQAQFMVSACELKFMGVKSRELSFSVAVSREASGSPLEGYYLVQAFNSVRFFAFCERMFFSTPYDHADVQVEEQLPAGIRLSHRQQRPFSATMSTAKDGTDRVALTDSDDGWAGPIFLPRRKVRAGDPGKLFFGKLVGRTQTYAFDGADKLTISPSTRWPIFQWLLDSGLTGREWIIREQATHGKSKTIRRDAV